METSYVTDIYEPLYGERNVRVKFKIKKIKLTRELYGKSKIFFSTFNIVVLPHRLTGSRTSLNGKGYRSRGGAV